MTRDEKIARARELAADGWRQADIARELRVVHSTVWKWLNPERCREITRDTNRRRRAIKQAWERENYTKSCADCGTTISRRSTRCRECFLNARAARRDARREHIAELWQEGIPMAEIAERVGLKNTNSLSVQMELMKRDGWELPPRRAGWRGHTRKPGRPPNEEPPKSAREARHRYAHARLTRRLVPPDTCERCGVADTRLHGHHHDLLAAPLEVEWLCQSCHIAEHGGIPRAA